MIYDKFDIYLSLFIYSPLVYLANMQYITITNSKEYNETDVKVFGHCLNGGTEEDHAKPCEGMRSPGRDLYSGPSYSKA